MPSSVPDTAAPAPLLSSVVSGQSVLDRAPRFPTDILRSFCDALQCSCADMDEPAVRALCDEVTFQVVDVLFEAKKYLTGGKRRRLCTRDIDRAVQRKGFAPSYGFSAAEMIPFKMASGGGREVYFHENTELPLEKIASRTLPKLPISPSIRTHWLAIGGVQPEIPENPSSKAAAESANRLKENMEKAEASNKVQDQLVNIRTVSTHELSAEKQLYYKELTEACMGRDENRRKQALQSLATDTGLQSVLQRIILFVVEGIRVNVICGNQHKLLFDVRCLRALLDNPTVDVSRHLHTMLPCIMSCVLSRRLSPSLESEREVDYSLREHAASLVAKLVLLHDCETLRVRDRVLALITRALRQDGGQQIAFTTLYGCLCVFSEMGSNAIRQFLVNRVFSIGVRIKATLDSNAETALADRKCAESCRNLAVQIFADEFRSIDPPISESECMARLGLYLGPLVFNKIRPTLAGKRSLPEPIRIDTSLPHSRPSVDSPSPVSTPTHRIVRVPHRAVMGSLSGQVSPALSTRSGESEQHRSSTPVSTAGPRIVMVKKLPTNPSSRSGSPGPRHSPAGP